MHDIVYILKEDAEADELRYSLRSLSNFPHGKVWFFGGQPEGLMPDKAVPLEQKGVTSWDKVKWTIEQVCRTREVTDDFWLFNDDFFVMKPVEEWTPKYDKTIYRRIQQIEKRHGGSSYYSSELNFVRELLTLEHLKTYNYAVHMPMLINKRKALEVIRKFPRCPMFRCVYGNYWRVGGEQMADCKITDPAQEPEDTVMLSTSDGSFRHGLVGEYIKNAFPDKCRYEE